MTADRNQKDDAVHQADPPATEVPTRWVGPLRLSGNAVTGDVEVPLATYETPLRSEERRVGKECSTRRSRRTGERGDSVEAWNDSVKPKEEGKSQEQTYS